MRRAAVLIFAVMILPGFAHGEVIAIVGGTVVPMRSSQGPVERLEDCVVVISGARIACVGTKSECVIPAGARRLDAKGGVVVPGFFDALTQVGIIEVSAEPSSGQGEESVDPLTPHVRAIDGLVPSGRVVDAARRGGVTSVLSWPVGGAFVPGQSAILTTQGALPDAAVQVQSAAMHARLGDDSRWMRVALGQTRAGQIARLRADLIDARSYAEARRAKPRAGETRVLGDARKEALASVADRRLPLVVHAHRAEDILSALRLAQELKLRLVIAAGAEAHLVANQLAAADVPVILAPVRVAPHRFETRRATLATAARLVAAGVKVALSTGSVYDVRNLRWEAAFAVSGGLDAGEALRAITRRPAEIFGLAGEVGMLEAGRLANVVVFDDEPLDIRSHVRTVIVRGVPDPSPEQR